MEILQGWDSYHLYLLVGYNVHMYMYYRPVAARTIIKLYLYE